LFDKTGAQAFQCRNEQTQLRKVHMPLRHNLIVVTAVLATAVFALLFLSTAVRPQTAVAGNATPDSFNYLPLVLRSELPTATPTATATATIPAPTVAPANVQITLIVYNGRSHRLDAER
jgi:hypothetical protein